MQFKARMEWDSYKMLLEMKRTLINILWNKTYLEWVVQLMGNS